jgi:tetratricopeptide (TPR) repeat protein
VEHGFFRFGLKLTFQGKWQMAFTLAGALIVSAFYFSLPTIARAYNERAIEFQQIGDLSTALKSYERAVSLYPGYAVAHYNLASAYEDVEAFDEALAEYQTALRADPKFYFAHNNLARLYLLRRKDHASALNILNSALDLRPKETQVKYSLYKNRGWAHLGLGYYDLAVADLRESLNWRQDGAAAHCLLAQALEAQRKEATARPEWEACLVYAAGEADVEASWLSLARKRLEQGEQK